MRVAIIGGGASGLVTAHLIDGIHDVTVFERDSVLGGNIRTLGGNVTADVPGGHVLDAGVIEFERKNFPTVRVLLERLGCGLRAVPACTTFWTRDGVHHLSPLAAKRTGTGWVEQLFHLPELWALRSEAWMFDHRAAESSPLTTLGDLMSQHDADRWMALLTTYAYSIPYERVGEVPAALAVPMLHAFRDVDQWYSVEGGVWDYLRRILERFSGRVYTDARVQAVHRGDQVQITLEDGQVLEFDKIVFATPPDQVLTMLADATDAERRRFGSWTPNHATVLIHHDRSLYDRRGVRTANEFDVFETNGGGGYNAWLNALCGVPTTEKRWYGLAFGLDDEISPDQVFHRQKHHTPNYNVAAFQWRDEVITTNGERHTWFAGAWLGDGLHEGAVRSAVKVARGLGIETDL